ncbi:hypothetical protein MBORA_05230 [Methanobrevibacter oralis]|uniref:Uncharacterized protein n=1 Tax=Methanobrevibacter oralis TaxID=66851 RepID=A0A166BNR5_METOA|nr:hypothetical protein [Methanobrevibacter oralis]KZX13613.1 hypothetical protein MBORA_05230 [Methanobrevibacter oralis]
MHVKDILDDLGLRIKIPQHWYSTDVHNDFEEAELVENDDVIKIRVENDGKVRMIIIDVNDGMSVVTKLPNGKVNGVKYLNNKDDFEYIGKPSDLYL